MRSSIGFVAVAAVTAAGCQSSGHYGVLDQSRGKTLPSACTNSLPSEFVTSFSADWFRFGSISASRALVAGMQRDLTNGTDISMESAHGRVACLSALYGVRSHRQQVWMDTGARTTFAGTVGWALAEGSTQAAWGGIALLPALLGQAEAFHPTRSLFSAGQSSLDALLVRYSSFQNIMRDQAFDDLVGQTRVKLGENCVLSVSIDQAAAMSTEARREADAAIESLGSACRLVGGQALSLSVLTRTMSAPSSPPPPPTPAPEDPELPPKDPSTNPSTKGSTPGGNTALTRRLLCDVLFIDQQVLMRDQQSRTTPQVAAGRLATSPLRALDTFFSDNREINADQLRATQSLEDLTVRYTGMPELKAMASELSSFDDSRLTARISELEPLVARKPSASAATAQDPTIQALEQQAQAVWKSNDALLAVLKRVRDARLALIGPGTGIAGAISALHGATTYMGDLAAPSAVRFKYDVGSMTFTLQPVTDLDGGAVLRGPCR